MTATPPSAATGSGAEPSYRFKIASEPWEFEQVHRLNYQTFVEEIPQHAPNPDGSLVDKFHAENTYLICLHDRELVGMIAVRGNRPFSLDQKLPDLDALLPPATRICEYRLLSVAAGHRKGRVFIGLIAEVARYCFDRGYDLAIISGTTRQAKLYRHIGFEPFGPVVGTGDAVFQPMYLTLATAQGPILALLSEPWAPLANESFDAKRDAGTVSRANGIGERAPAPVVNLLPGPVDTSPAVRAAFARDPISHRAEHFAALIAETRARLNRLTRAQHVHLLMGTGTLANDVVCAQLSTLSGRGIILSNGEFGERLVDHAARFGLVVEVIRAPWGAAFDPETIAGAMSASGVGEQPTWLWMVHCETSTGVLNDLPGMAALCRSQDIRLAVDGISSIGTLPVDLSGVWLASGVSGKGLASFPGLALVFANHPVAPAPSRLPRYLDLGCYASAGDGIPFTISSNLVMALHTALGELDPTNRFGAIAQASSAARSALGAAGLRVVAAATQGAPAVLTIALPTNLNSDRAGAELRDRGFLLSYQSRYLLDRNWIQICFMGCNAGAQDIGPLCELLGAMVTSVGDE